MGRPALALAIVLTVALNAVAYRHAVAMLHFTLTGERTARPEDLSLSARLAVLATGITVPRPTSSLEPSDIDPACRPIEIPSADGVTLGAWYCGIDAASPLVILFHGYAEEKTRLSREARIFIDNGLSVLLVDFRGSGDSSSDYTTIGVAEAEDVAAVVDHAGTHLDHPKLVLFGRSMGAAAILRAIHSHEVKPDAVIVEAVFDRLIATVANRFRSMGLPAFPFAHLLIFWGGVNAGFDGFDHIPARDAAAVKCPILFMHGADDPRATMEQGRRVFDAVRSRKSFVVFPETSHESFVGEFAEKWEAEVMSFLRASVIGGHDGE